jgi:hypothetical protein
MEGMITNEADLHRANIRVAWSFAERMTSEQFEELCRVTLRAWTSEGEPRDEVGIVGARP